MEKKGRLNSDRVLIICFGMFFLLLMTVQVALTSQTVRERFYMDDELEGTPLVGEVFLYDSGEIVLELIGRSSSPELKVLVNGDEACSFTSSVISVKVKNGDVLELDGSGLDEQLEVKVLSKSENIRSDFVNKKFSVKSGIRRIGKVRVKQEKQLNV